MKNWHSPQKYIEKSTRGKCPYCHKFVKSLEAHIKSKHKKEKVK